MDEAPAGQDLGAGSVSAFIAELSDDAISRQLAPCPDWPDLN